MVEAPAGQAPPVHVFYSYADEDQAGFEQLYSHMTALRRSQVITDWHHGMLSGRAERQTLIGQQLKQAAVMVPLISAAYLNSQYYTSELEWSLRRYTTDKLFRVVPVLLRPVETEGLPFTRLQCVPRNGTAVTRWPDQDEALLEVVRSIRTTIETLQAEAKSGGLMAPLVPTRTRPRLFLAPEKPADLVERPQEFAAVKQGLLDRRRETPTAITTALEGAGGYGKTTLALMLCHDPDVWSVFPDGILWVTLGQHPGSLIGKVEALVTALSNQPESFTTLEAATARLTALLSERDVLLVIDDVWNSDDLKPFLTEGKRSARLITTRKKEILPATTRSFTIDVMYTDEAVQLLSLGVEQAVQTEQEQQALHGLASQLGAWPLLLKLANAALREYVSKGETLLTALANVKMVLTQSSLVAYDVETARNRTQAVEATLQVNFELLTPAQYARFRELAIFPEDTDIPLATVQKLWGATGGLDMAATAALCQRLHATSMLLDFNPTRRTIRLHDVIRTYLRTEASTELSTLTARFLAAYGLPNWADLPSNEPYLWEHLAYHLLEAGRSAELVTTVKDLHYLARKTLLKKTYAVESDLLQAEQQAPTDTTLPLLKRGYSQMSHLLNRCSSYAEVATVLHSRLLHLSDFAAACRQLEPSMRRPYLTSWHLLPDLPDPALIRTLQGHADAVNRCVVGPDGTWIVSTSWDGTLKIWDARTGACLTTLHVDGELRDCAFCPDGEHLVAVGQRGVYFLRVVR